MKSANFSRRHLVAILGKLGSSQDGEVLVAARFAHAMVTDAGMTWDQVLSAGPGVVSGATQSPPDPPVRYGVAVIHAPHNGRWVDTVLLLLRLSAENEKLLMQSERDWLNARMAAWSRRSIRFDEGYRINMLYKVATARPGAR